MEYTIMKVVCAMAVIGIIILIAAGVIQDTKDQDTVDHLCFPYQVMHSYKENNKLVAVCRSEDGGLVIKQ